MKTISSFFIILLFTGQISWAGWVGHYPNFVISKGRSVSIGNTFFPYRSVHVIKFFMQGNSNLFQANSPAHVALIMGQPRGFIEQLQGQGLILGNVSGYWANIDGERKVTGCQHPPYIQVESYYYGNNMVWENTCSPKLLPNLWYHVEVHSHPWGVAYVLHKASCYYNNCYKREYIFDGYFPTNYNEEMDTQSGRFIIGAIFFEKNDNLYIRNLEWGYYTY